MSGCVIGAFVTDPRLVTRLLFDCSIQLSVRNAMRVPFAVISLLIAVLSATLLPPPVGAQTAPAAATTSSLIVKVVAGLTADEQAAVVARNGGTLTSSIPALRLLIISVATENVDTTLA